MKFAPNQSIILPIVMMLFAVPVSVAQSPDAAGLDLKIAEFEQKMAEMQTQLDAMKEMRSELQALIEQDRSTLHDLSAKIQEIENKEPVVAESALSRFTVGGYGDIHANFNEGNNEDIFDIHRLVLYMGYDFADWIKFHSEVEIEHARAPAPSPAASEAALHRLQRRDDLGRREVRR